jgi:amino acid adenylation domain-containing protein
MTHSEISRLLRAALEERLLAGLGPQDDQKSFLQLGVDSVVATELIELIRREFDPAIGIAALFDYPSIDQLSRYLAMRGRNGPVGLGLVESIGQDSHDPLRNGDELFTTRASQAAARVNDDEAHQASKFYQPIAVIGLSGRFAGANDAQRFWQNLVEGICSITEIPSDRSRYWDLAGLAKRVGRSCRWGGFLTDIESFDPLFFGISPGEAAMTDPQQRLFLEEAWKAIEDAGYAGDALSDSRCGVFAGVLNTDYQDLLTQVNALTPKPHELMGSAASILAGRIAYHLNLRGPAIAVDAACSSSLVAIHLACRALQLGEVNLALAGGVTLYLTQKRYNLMEQVGMLSHTGKCRPFDDAADGTIPGEGVGVVVLKRLKDAITAGDSIYGVIVASGTNQAGKTNGITAPSMRSQFELLNEVNRRGGIAPESIDYIEAHGTGTTLGDPIEFEALKIMLRDAPGDKICRLGSLKANLGHTTAAAGVVGLIKLLLALQHQKMPPQIHFENPNRHTDFTNARLKINTTVEPWERQIPYPRRAALSAFGFAGTNGHLVVEETPESPTYGSAKPECPFWIILSARTPEALKTRANELAQWLVGPGKDVSLVDLSFTLALGRTGFEERLAFQAHCLTDVTTGLQRFLSGLIGDPLWTGRVCSSPAAELAYSCRGEAWVAGAEVSWTTVYADFKPVRLHLPTYPFARECYWYDLLETTPVGKTDELAVRRSDQSSDRKIPPNRTVKLKNLAEVLPPAPESAANVVAEFESRIRGDKPVGTDLLDFSTPASDPASDLTSAGTLKTGEVLDQLRKLVAKTLYLEENRVQDNTKFADLGLDSILAVELVKRLNAAARLNLSTATLYSYPTARQLAVYVASLLAGKRPDDRDVMPTRFAPKSTEEATRIRAEPTFSETDQPAEAESGNLRPRGRRILIDRSGIISDLQIVTDQLESPAPSEVQIKVEAASVMLADLLCVHGLYPTMPEYPFTPGFEIAGTVTAVGGEASGFAPGDRVYGLAGARLGGQAEKVNIDARLISRMPDQLTAAEACTLPVSFVTAQHALFEIGKLSAGENVLIHSATSCTGLMAIQLATRAGAQVFATVGAAEKIAYLQSLGLRHVFNYQSPELFQEIGAALSQRRFDIILNLLNGPVRDRSLTLLGPGGRFLDLAVAGLKIAPPVAMAGLFDNQSYFGIDCRRLSLQQPAYVGRLLSELRDFVQRGEVRPLPISHRFALSEAPAAYAVLESRQTIGRVVLLPNATRGSMPDDQPMPRITAISERQVAERTRGQETVQLSTPVKSGFEPIAIIGMSGRFPGANNLEQFWQNLAAGKSFIKEASDRVRFPNTLASGSQECFRGGFLEGFDEFDASFFQIARAEAEVMDPQHRLFLQEAWHTLEDAGHAPQGLAGKAGGIFVGIGPSEYYPQIKDLNAHALPANLGSGLTGRLAYLLDWTGPCLAIDTACSSSFSAIHLACMSLARHECEFALAGGVHVVASPKVFTATRLMGLLSVSGNCRTFDASADGWVIGEGVGAVMLKRLTDALRDRDHIHGVLRAGGINQDGAKNGFTAPKASSQAALQKRVYEQSGINPETIDYVEAHGLSSALGDEIELLALSETFAHFTDRKNFCAIGSLKPNIGHPLAASGMAALLKVLLALRYGKLPPLAELQHVNESLGFGTGPFFLRHALSDWPPRDGQPRRAAINGLSASGTNCHLVVEEYLPETLKPHQLPGSLPAPVLLVLSARDALKLGEAAANLLRFLESDRKVQLLDLAFTLQVGRQPMEERLAWTASSLSEASDTLRLFVSNQPGADFFCGNVERIDPTASLLVSGPEGEQFLAAASRNGSLDKLGRLWVAGVEIDWNLLYEKDRPRRVSLPGYPFARNRYWYGDAVRSAGEAVSIRTEPITSAASVTDDVVRLLGGIIAGVLGCPPAEIDADRDLGRYGFGSLYVLGVIDQLEVATGLRIPAKAFFECRTLRELAQRVAAMPSAPRDLSPRTRNRQASIAAEPHQTPGDRQSGNGFPLSEGQKALWSIQKANPRTTAYNVPLAFFWDGSLDLAILEAAWEQIVEAQPALRATFPFGAGEPMQKILPLGRSRVQREDLTDLHECEISQRILRAAQQPFELEQGPLWRLYAFSVPTDRNIVLIAIHHIIFDGRSLGLVWTDLVRRYRQIESGTRISSERNCITLADYVRVEREYLESERYREDKAYWVDQFPLGFFQLGFAPRIDDLGAEHGEVFQTSIPKLLVAGLLRVSEAERVTLQSVFLAAFTTLLARISGREAVATGVAADVRPSAEFKDTVGFFVNVLAISTAVNSDESFRTLLHRVFDRLVDALEHRRFPFRRLVQVLTERVGDLKELETAFYFQTWQSPDQATLAEKLVPGVHQAGEFGLVFEVIEGMESWYLNVKYRPAVFDAGAIKRFASEFCRFLELVAEDPEKRITDLLPIDRALPNRLPSFEYPHKRCTHQLIEDQASRRPDKLAVRFLDQQITYRELDARGNRLGRRLIEAGVRPGGLVGVLVDRSIEMLVALVAVWKAGAAYVPLDPNHPAERTDYILRDAQVDLVLSQTGRWHRAEIPVLDLDRQPAEAEPSGGVLSSIAPGSNDVAYVIYTSGSTGNPKGVQISHRSLTHFLCSMAQRPGCTLGDYVLASTTICFDIAALELFLPLIAGACVEILPDAISKNGFRFREKIENSPVTLIQGTPATWKMLIAAGLGKIPRVKALCGGEAWDGSLADQLLDRAGEVWNMYGPTETTIWSSIQKVERGQAVRLGEPIGNTEFYVFDESMRLVSSGETGELYIGGDGLAKGYLNRPDLTRERFVPNPFRPTELIYRTGDLVRYV